MLFRIFQENRAVHGLCRDIKQNIERIFKITTRLNGHCVFFPLRQLTNFEV